MKLRWTRPALADLDEAQGYIARENPAAAQLVAARVWESAQKLLDQPQIGRAGHVAGTRKRVVDQTPYLIVYRMHGDTIEVLRLWHGKRNWQNS